MTLSLPADPPRARSLTGVVPQMIASLDGRSDWFTPATSAIVFVLDGLGAHSLAARAGHARFLSQASSKKDVVRTVFPSTTASALDEPAHGHTARAARHRRVPSAHPRHRRRSSTSCEAGTPTVCRSSGSGRSPLDHRASELRRVEGRVRGHRLHRRDASRCRVPCRGRARRARRGRRRPRRTASGLIRVRLRARTRRHRPPSGGGSPTSGWPPWSGWMPRPAPSTVRSRAAPASSSPPTTAWSTCRATGTCSSPPATGSSTVCASSAVNPGCCTSTPRKALRRASSRPGARRNRRAPGCSRAARRSSRDCSARRGRGARADRRRARGRTVGDRVLRRPACRQGRAEDDRAARLAHQRRAHRAPHPSRRLRLNGAGPITPRCVLRTRSRPTTASTSGPFGGRPRPPRRLGAS